jgi:hypothetical protein
MHDVFEGVVPVELKLMLTRLIADGCFTYEYYCNCIASFEYDYSEIDKPVKMMKHCFISSDRLRLSAHRQW